MSRSRDLDVGDIGGEEVTNDKTFIETIIEGITKSSPWKSLAAGTVSGWLSGLAMARAGRGAAAGLGGGILLLQAAHLGGYVAVRWERVRAAASRLTVVIDRVLDFVKDNSCYSAGFAAGVCFGFAWKRKRHKRRRKAKSSSSSTVRRSPVPLVTESVVQPDLPLPLDASSAPPISTLAAPSPIKQLEPLRSNEDINTFLDKAPFITPTKPLSHSPKISPSSIPNPSPSVTTNKLEPGYPNYGGYLYSVPGYSAFQPVAYQTLSVAQNPPSGFPPPPTQTEINNPPSFTPFVPASRDTTDKSEADTNRHSDIKSNTENSSDSVERSFKMETDFEEKFTPEIVQTTNEVAQKESAELKINTTSIAQGSGATITTIPSKETGFSNYEPKKKQTERFSLKTSIPISKIDMKCVTTAADGSFQNALNKKLNTQFNQNSQLSKSGEVSQRVEIHSNIIIKSAQDDAKEIDSVKQQTITNSNTTDSPNKLDTEKNNDGNINETKDIKPNFLTQSSNIRPQICISSNQLSTELTNTISNVKPPDISYTEQKNQILFIQNKNNIPNPKMLLTITQPQTTSQVVLQRNNMEPKNLLAPSRLSSLSSKSNETLNETSKSAANKVVSLKRLHQDNGDENDFENLITENQIYGNKIVVKEKSQGIQQEQDLKVKSLANKNIATEKSNRNLNETNNLVLQSNILYVSNVQFPANLMMIKNNTKGNVTDSVKVSKGFVNENNAHVDSNANSNGDTVTVAAAIKSVKCPPLAVSKEIHVLKTSNNVLHNLAKQHTNKATDLVFPTNQKVLMNPQILYQMPMIVEGDIQKISTSAFVSRDYQKIIKNDGPKQLNEHTKHSEKLFIACPYQVDSKMQPKIVITNIRSKVPKVEEVSSIDMYEKRRRLRRLRYLSNKEPTANKSEAKKNIEKSENRNILTPEKMQKEIYNEFAKSRQSLKKNSAGSDNDSDYGGDEVTQYEAIIKEFGDINVEETGRKEDFLSTLKLATRDVFIEKQMERQERMLQCDAVASACISAGRLDCIAILPTSTITMKTESSRTTQVINDNQKVQHLITEFESCLTFQKKKDFLAHLQLTYVPPKYRREFERAWETIVKDKRKRNGVTDIHNQPSFFSLTDPDVDLDPKGQLQLLTEIKKSVNNNNNLIKKRLDSTDDYEHKDSIHDLAEKNFSELGRLSKLADRSVKLLSDTRKRDLNPGFDSEKILEKRTCLGRGSDINIPDVSKIIALKSAEDLTQIYTLPAISMDEPKGSAAAVREPAVCQTAEVGCQSEDVEVSTWPGIDTLIHSYAKFDMSRRRQLDFLRCQNLRLCHEGGKAERNVRRAIQQSQAQLNERTSKLNEERSVRALLNSLINIIRIVQDY